MNLYYFDKIIYNGNINRDFFLYCCHKKKSLYLYILIHWLYYLLGIFFYKFELLYLKNYHKYLNKLDNIENITNEFYKKNNKKINKSYLKNIANQDIIITKSPRILIDKFINKENIITYELNSQNILDIDKYNKDISRTKNKFNIAIFSKFKDTNKFKSNYKYVYKYGSYIQYNEKLFKFLRIITNIILLLTLAILLLLISFTFTTVYLDKVMINSYLNDKLLIWLNLMPIIIVILLFLFLTKRLWLSFSITSLIIFIIGIVNKTKLYYRDDVFKFEDLSLIKEAAIMTERYKIIIRWYTVISIIFCLILALWLRKRTKKINIKYRYCLMLALLTLFVGVYQYKNVWTNTELYSSVGDTSNINIWIATRQSQIRGLIYPFIFSSTELTYKAPEGYNKEEAKKILNKYTYDNIPKDKKVNIISIMLEAYNDFSKFESIEIDNEVYKKLHDIEKESINGSIIVDIFGGGTVVTERNYITGYKDLPTFRKKTYSYASYFKEQGYVTEAMHPIYGSFYNRNTANINMGFDNYWNYENKFSEITPSFITDYYLFDYIIEGLETANKNNKPYFNFSVTYQNHGPYSVEPTSYNYIKDKGYSSNAKNMFNRYLDGIKSTNDALEKLVNYLKYYEEPTILVVFGDHNPYLGEEDYVYNELGIDMSINSIESFENYYSIPYFIYGNNEAKKVLDKDFKGEGNTISPNFLMNEVLDYINYKGNEYLKYTSNLKEHIDVINDIYYKEDNQYTLKSESKYTDKIKEFQCINYYYATSKNMND